VRTYDLFGALCEDEDFSSLLALDGQPSLSPKRLALVLTLQFTEGLFDRQVTKTVRTRIDWKYLLCLKLTEVGFDYSVLSKSRTQIASLP
jgi:transposase